MSYNRHASISLFLTFPSSLLVPGPCRSYHVLEPQHPERRPPRTVSGPTGWSAPSATFLQHGGRAEHWSLASLAQAPQACITKLPDNVVARSVALGYCSCELDLHRIERLQFVTRTGQNQRLAARSNRSNIRLSITYRPLSFPSTTGLT